MRPRVVILGMGDTGLLTAVRLARRADVTLVAPKGGMVSGQELGLRLAQPETWLSTSFFAPSRYRALRDATVVHGRASALDPDARTVLVTGPDGEVRPLTYDVLVVATGTTSGFWRDGRVETLDAAEARIRQQARALEAARSVAVVGGGPSGVSVAYNLKRRYPAQEVHLVHRGDAVLPSYPPRVRATLTRHLAALGVRLHMDTAAAIPAPPPDGPTPGPLALQSGDPVLAVDRVVWTTGAARPNTDFLPHSWLDPDGFVQVADTLEVQGQPGVFAVGDVAATDPGRSSARNAGHAVVAANVRARLRGQEPRKRFRAPPRHRWGSIVGLQPDGMAVYLPTGRCLHFPGWLAEWFLFRLVVCWVLFRGIEPFRLQPPRTPHPARRPDRLRS